MITYRELFEDEEISTYIKMADASLSALGYTEHSFAHVGLVAKRAGEILEALGAPARTVELARIAAHLHDIGNAVNRVGHSQSGALMAFRLLGERGMSPEEVATVMTAIGNHDEGEGDAVSDITAALILADKSDVRRSRVRGGDISVDIHDRVNYSVENSRIEINGEKTEITLYLKIDTAISSVMDYFEIFLGRMIMCRKAADFLDLRFKLNINGQQML